MPVSFNDQAVPQLREQTARLLLQAAIYLQTAHMQFLSVANPYPHDAPSRPGEYPKARTFTGRDNVAYEPTSLSEVARDLEVRVGYRANAWYMAWLEVQHARLGLVETLNRTKPQLEALAGGGQ